MFILELEKYQTGKLNSMLGAILRRAPINPNQTYDTYIEYRLAGCTPVQGI